jgi:hypothetical protein
MALATMEDVVVLPCVPATATVLRPSPRREHLCAVPDGQAALLRRDELGVVVEDCGGHDHDVGGFAAVGAGDVVA